MEQQQDTPVVLEASAVQELAAIRQKPAVTAPASDGSAPVTSSHEPVHSNV